MPLGSRNDFFENTPEKLAIARESLIALLTLKGRGVNDTEEYLEAYDWFCANPKTKGVPNYDGATVVKDLVDIRFEWGYLDADAMKHDYDYIVNRANTSWIRQWKADMKYIKNMEKNGKGIRVFRFLLLRFIGVFFIPYTYLKYSIKRWLKEL